MVTRIRLFPAASDGHDLGVREKHKDAHASICNFDEDAFVYQHAQLAWALVPTATLTLVTALPG
jgi:hypothetical protein